MRTDPDIRHVVMGYGVSGRHHAWIVRRLCGVKLVAIIDTDEATRAVAQADYPECTVLSDLHLLAPEAWDSLSVCTPDQSHVESVAAALTEGKHVLCEKPLAASSSELKRIDQKWTPLLLVNFHNRFNPVFARAHQHAIETTGELIARCWFHEQSHGMSWRSPLHYLGSHLLDLAMWFWGRDWSISQCHSGFGGQYWSWTLEHENVRIEQEVSFLRPKGARSPVSMGMCMLSNGREFHYESADVPLLTMIDSQREAILDAHVAYECAGEVRGFAADAVRHFFACISRGASHSPSSLTDAIHVTHLIERIQNACV